MMSRETEEVRRVTGARSPTGSGRFVEFTFDVPSLYPFVTHKFATASKGALGVFLAGEVETPEGGVEH